MSKFERIPVRDNEAIELCDRDDGSLEICVIVKGLGAATPIVLDQNAEKALSIKLQLRERRRLTRRVRRGAGGG